MFGRKYFVILISSVMAISLAANAQRSSDYERVPLKPILSFQEMVKTYPVLAPGPMPDGTPYQIKESDKDGVYIAELKKEDKKILFQINTSEDFCGSLGCGMSVYVNNGKSYVSAMNVTAQVKENPIYLSKDWRSIAICTDRGEWVEWTYDTKLQQYSYKAPYANQKVFGGSCY